MMLRDCWDEAHVSASSIGTVGTGVVAVVGGTAVVGLDSTVFVVTEVGTVLFGEDASPLPQPPATNAKATRATDVRVVTVRIATPQSWPIAQCHGAK